MHKYNKWSVLAMLCFAFFFHQADRALFGLLTVPIQNELKLTDVQIGWINTVLSWVLAVMSVIAGTIGDRFSRKWLITGSLIFWSLMTITMGFTGDWTLFDVTIPAFFVVMFFRSIATGGGESFYNPAAMSLLASHHRETRSVALSVYQGALYVGLMASGVISAWALGFLGTWRHVFMAFGAGGFLLGVFFVFALKDTAREARTPAEKADGQSVLAGFRYFFRTPTALCAMGGFSAIVFVNNAYLFWAPKFMTMKFGVTVGEAGTRTMLWHHMAAFVAILIGGIVTDRFVRPYPRFRIGFQAVALALGAPCLALIGFAPGAAAMVAMTAAYGIFRGFYEVNTHATLFDVVPSAYRATAVGIFTFFAFIVGGLSGIVMGALSEHYDVSGFEVGFAAMGGTYLLGALLMAFASIATFRKDRIAE